MCVWTNPYEHAVHTDRSPLACVSPQGKSKTARKTTGEPEPLTDSSLKQTQISVRILPSIHSLIPKRASYHAAVEA